jgi:hypothetical protein
MRLTTSHHKTLLLWKLNKGGQAPIWAVAPLDGWIMRLGCDFYYKTIILNLNRPILLIIESLNADITKTDTILTKISQFTPLRLHPAHNVNIIILS